MVQEFKQNKIPKTTLYTYKRKKQPNNIKQNPQRLRTGTTNGYKGTTNGYKVPQTAIKYHKRL